MVQSNYLSDEWTTLAKGKKKVVCQCAYFKFCINELKIFLSNESEPGHTVLCTHISRWIACIPFRWGSFPLRQQGENSHRDQLLSLAVFTNLINWQSLLTNFPLGTHSYLMGIGILDYSFSCMLETQANSLLPTVMYILFFLLFELVAVLILVSW